MNNEKAPDGAPHLIRHFNTLQATALNMSNMIGIGPFLTIPLLISALGGPQAMLGWLLALLIVIPDGMVWSELGAAMPGSGGSYVYLREGFGRETFGRLMAFLFIWQFIISGPMEIASGYIGFAQYMDYIWKAPQFSAPIGGIKVYSVAIIIGLINIALLYRQITRIGKITVSLWIGALLTTGAVILTGALYFDPKIAFDFPPGAFKFSTGFLFGLGAASRIGVYDYLGYYDICYIGDEVKNPGRTIPRSVIISVIAVAVIYVAINFSIIGTIPWREFAPADERKPLSDFVVSVMMERIYGSKVATAVTVMILWTALGSCFALLLGYSRIPFAAARDGYFFKVFSRLHPKHSIPHVSLLVIGVIAIICSFFSLGTVIDVLIATRIIVQFAGQIFAVALLRKNAPSLERPYRIWLYPLPSLIALAGWLFIYLTLDHKIILFSLVALAAGVVSFLAWSRGASKWPFTAPSPIPNR
ncbi:MAG TPA: amino acid permease [Blastocatellia bacterium]|jgi:amino acid transporter|nr:amino acid permease [Blastocatellia bacterium]